MHSHARLVAFTISRTCSVCLLEIGDASASSAHLTAYAGIAAATHRSGR